MNLLLTVWLATGTVRSFEVPASDCLMIVQNHAAGWRSDFDDVPTGQSARIEKVTCTPPRTDNLY